MKSLYVVGILGITGTFVANLWVNIDFELAANVSLAYVGVLASIFAVRYAGWSRWWSNRIGKIYLIKSLILALVLMQNVVAVWWNDDFTGRQVIRFIIYSLGATAYVPMLVTLVREQLRDRRRRDDEEDC